MTIEMVLINPYEINPYESYRYVVELGFEPLDLHSDALPSTVEPSSKYCNKPASAKSVYIEFAVCYSTRAQLFKASLA